MENIIDGITVLKQTPIKDYSTLSSVFTWFGVFIMILAVVIMIIKYKQKIELDLNNKKIQRIFLLYAVGFAMSMFSMIHFPWFYTETGRYTYKCTLEDDITANYIGDNFNVISVEDGIWTIRDKE